jgi:dnd system-associated protein 4
MAVPDLFFCEQTIQIVSRLSEVKDEETKEKLFQSFAQLAIFAGVWSISKNLKPKKLQHRSREIPGTAIENGEFDKVIDVILLSISKDVEILDPKNTKDNYLVFEEYVNSGLLDLQKFLKNEDNDHIGLNKILHYLKEMSPQKVEKPDTSQIKI